MRTLRDWQWELTLLALIALSVAWASSLSPFYLNLDQISYSLQQSIAVVGLLAAGMMVIVVVGEIDISIPAILAISNIVFARISEAGAPVVVAFPLILILGTLAGALNGALVVSFALPSLAVTLGTMGAYRALALLFGGQEGYAGFDDGLYLARRRQPVRRTTARVASLARRRLRRVRLHHASFYVRTSGLRRRRQF